jgi:hypothetical protein
MQNMKTRLFGTALFVLSTAVQAQMALKLDAQAAQNFGVRTTVLEGTEELLRNTLDARVLEPSSLYVMFSDIDQSRNALAISSVQAARMARLYRNQQNTTLSALGQATLAAQTDQNSLARAQTALRTTWGDVVAGWNAPERARRLLALRTGRAGLVRVELDSVLPVSTQWRIGDTTLEWLGLLPTADPQTGRPGALLWLARGLPALSRLQVQANAVGLMSGSQNVEHPKLDHAKDGASVLIPRSAILRINGGSFAFIQTAEDAYVMRELINPERSADGWRVRGGFYVGERIVSAGAASLLTMARGAGAAE